MGHWTGRPIRRLHFHQASPPKSCNVFFVASITTISLHLLLHPYVAATNSEDNQIFLTTEQKRAGARAFNFAPDEKRAGPRAFNFAPEEKRAGARAFNFAPDEKRAGARAFNFAPDEKRGGARAVLAGYDKRGGGRAFSADQLKKRGGGRAFQDGDGEQLLPLINELKRAGARVFQLDDSGQFNFAPDERKRGGARPFYGGGYMDGTWKRAGGRYFMRHFGDSPFGGWMEKRGGGRAFFGGMDAMFSPSNYWTSQRFVRPINKLPRRSLMMSALPSVEVGSESVQQKMAPPPSFFFDNNHNFDGRANGRKRGGAHIFNEDAAIPVPKPWEKRASDRESFIEHEDDRGEEKRFGEQLAGQ